MPANQSRLDVLQGTLDLLILRALRSGELHGWAISERIQQISPDVLRVNQGPLYPALHRLEEGISLATLGLLLGLCGTYFVGRVMKSLLYDVKIIDPATLAARRHCAVAFRATCLLHPSTPGNTRRSHGRLAQRMRPAAA